jgi:group II intron reverse transcriptase/maturase
MLGVPTVVDRLVQQAIAQVLEPIFDPGFSEHSYGFRPGRGAHQAVRQAQVFLEDGSGWVVDVDLDAFFDRVNHDKLMHRVWRRVADRRLLRLIRAFLEAGIMVDGVRQASAEGTPQGSPLSPLLSNIMLDDLDRELERRGHRFVRYADDLRVFVRSERAAWRVLDGVSGFVEGRLGLKVNQAKSSVVRIDLAMLLGFGFYMTAGTVKIRIDPRALRRLKGRIRRLTRRHGGESIRMVIHRVSRFIRGWMAYFGIVDAVSVFGRLDGWLRRRLRAMQWALWKTPRRRMLALRALGCPEGDAFHVAYSRAGTWDLASSGPVQRALSNKHWTRLGLIGFDDAKHRLRNH